MAVWAKTKDSSVAVTLLGSVPTYATRFLLWPANGVNQLTLAFSDKPETEAAISTVDNEDRFEWRHLAVTFSPPTSVQFYKNGKEWPLKQGLKANYKFIQSTHIALFNSPDGETAYKGRIALVTVFQRALSKSELMQ